MHFFTFTHVFLMLFVETFQRILNQHEILRFFISVLI
jgi:hypothetical protein